MAAYEFPTSFGQRQMWLLAQVDSDEPTYNIAWALWLDGALDVSALRRAWNAALARHEALRTTFRNESGVPVQVIEDEPPAPSLPVTSVQFGEGEFGEGEIGEGEQESAALALISDLAKAPIDLAAGPLARAALVRLSADAHVLAVVMHHIVADGWSLRILSDELSADYEAISRGADPVAAEPPIQYADFAIWQIEHAESGGYAAAERFWRAELADAQPALALPTDEPYPVNQTFAARHIDTTIDAKLADGLRQLAARLGTTRFAVLLAAYAVVLSRLTGACDLLIAVPMAARTRPETESVVGLFMNTVPIRIQIDAAATLGDLVRSVHNATARALAHQELPFAKVVELVRPDRDPARLPLVQVSFAMEEPSVIEDRGGLRWRSELMDTGTAKFEIELKVTDGPTDPQVRLNYNCDLFHPATAQLVADGFTAILRCLSDDPGRVVADAEIMSPETLALVTRVWPDGGQVADPDATAVAQLWAACDGDSVVAIGSDGALTGADVRNLAMAIAAALGGHGVGVSDRVAILLPRGPSILAAILGIWTIGASYVPLDPIYPPQRLTTMLADSGAAAIVVDTSAPDAPQPPANATPIPAVDLAHECRSAAPPGLTSEERSDEQGGKAAPKAPRHRGVPGGRPPGLEGRSAAPPGLTSEERSEGARREGGALKRPDMRGVPGGRPPGLTERPDMRGVPGGRPPGLAAVTIFTSGSTGRPKAVSVTQGGIATLLNAVRPMLALGQQDRFVAVSTFAFDIALVEIVAPVLAGGCVVFATAEQALDAVRLRALLADSGATALQATPAGWRMLVDAGGIPAGVRLRLTAGEPLPRDLADAIGAGAGVRLWNLYGPTETTIYSGGDAVGPSPAPIEIGSIIAGTQLYVLDSRLRPVAPGVIGEVYIGGAGVANGYHNAPGMTAGRFVPDPFGGRPGARLYRTGDLGRWRGSAKAGRSGKIELAGRADRQIKIRGYRIESAEVEAALRGQDDIAQAVVSVRGGGADVRLVGYLVTRSGAGEPPAGLRERLLDVLPDYMVPAAFVVLPALPLTGSGKIDHRALPEPDWSAVLGRIPVAPRTPVESQLAAIFAELLALSDPVGVGDNFFALGGHSLTATKLMARIRAVYGVDLPVRTLFADPTVAGLATALAAAGSGAHDDDLPLTLVPSERR